MSEEIRDTNHFHVDGDSIFKLEQIGYRKGEPQLANQWQITVRHRFGRARNTETEAMLRQLILDFLNSNDIQAEVKDINATAPDGIEAHRDR